jgi:hypothetical protein
MTIGIVEYIPSLSPTKQGGDLFVGSVQLVAGRNEVDIDKWNEFADHPLIKSRKEQGLIRVLFEQPTIIVPSEAKKTTRTSAPVETKLVAQEITPEVANMSAFVVRPSEVEKTPTLPKK